MSTRFSRRNRDDGLRRISAVTSWTIAGALAGSGLFAGLAAQTGRGSAAGRATTTGVGASSVGRSPSATIPTDDSGRDEGFAQSNPAPAPTVSPSNGFAPIVSGAS